MCHSAVKVSDVAYKVEFPSHVTSHNVVHVSKLKPYVDGRSQFPDRPAYTPPPPPDIIDGEEHFSVEAFRAHRRIRGTLMFRVKWTQHTEDENTLEPAWRLKQDLDEKTYSEMLKAYQKKNPKAANLTVNDI